MATFPPRQGLAPLPDKVWFRIGEVAALLGVETHVVRFWQGQFSSVRPERSTTGRFLYTRAAVERLQHIRHLLHVQGFTIAGARKALASERPGSAAPASTVPPTAVSPNAGAAVSANAGAAVSANAGAAVSANAGAAVSAIDPARERRIVELEAETLRQAQELRALAGRLQASESSSAGWQAREAALEGRLERLADDLAAEVDALALAVVESLR
ncbi:MAG: MerR family transcriptional regulator [Myxococcales bacterium]|nr:MerR family transcriptional regulator [Myxococcales bacterium]